MWLMAAVIIVIVIEALLILKWKISATALAYYMELKKYTPPTAIEVEVCTKKVTEHMIKDLIGRK